MKYQSVTTMVLALSIAGCAFRSPEGGGQPAPTPDLSEQTGPNNPPKAAVMKRSSLKMSWKLEDNSMSEPVSVEPAGTLSSLALDRPIIVPHSAPDEVHFEIRPSTQRDLVKRVTVQGWVGPESGIPYNLEVKESNDSLDGGSIQFSAFGFSKLLSTTGESLALVQIHFFGETDKTPLETVSLNIMTPPSKVSKDQKAVSAFDEKFSPAAQKLKFLNSVGVQLALVQFVPIRNDSQWPLVVEIPVRMNGRLSSSMTRLNLTQSFCGHSIARQDWEEEFASELVAIPLSDDTPRTFSNSINEAFAVGNWGVTLEPGEQKMIGIYAYGPKAVALLKEGHAVQRFSTVDAVSGCRSRCGNPRTDMYDWDGIGKATNYWQQKGWPGASRACNSIRVYRILPEQPHPDENAMNQCAEWELSNGTSPWDDRRFCHSPEPGNGWHYPNKEFWSVTKSTTPVTVGTSSGPVVLKLSADSTWYRARFAFPGVAEKTPARTFVDFMKSETIVME